MAGVQIGAKSAKNCVSVDLPATSRQVGKTDLSFRPVAWLPALLPFADQIRQLHPTMGIGTIPMKTRGNIILIAGGKSGGGRGFAEAVHPFGLRETLYFVWGDIR